ncbi:MAG: hypothetical protein LAO08_06470 [Acidobacteriia bacterium]|nr:hypothetical protein [Terriglobia bacterium]
MGALLNAVFGCSHGNYSFPQTPKGRNRPEAAAITGTYVACLDCGKDLPYDMNEMKIVDADKVALTITPVLEG